jgi:uncharacterized phage protein gp47/JayE
MTFRRRTYPEVVDNLLTTVVGGVSAEAHPFPPAPGGPPHSHLLQQPPVADIVSVFGSRDGAPHLFRKGIDYELQPDKQTLEWKLEGAQLPDPGTLVHVNYHPESARPIVTDLHVGSVTRTLVETIGLEMARLYAQMQSVYDSAFIDTSEGRALDNVVALLGIGRVTGGRAAGDIEFGRARGTSGTINIPAGTRVITADGEIEYATVVPVTMPDGQNVVRVPARDVEAGNDPLPAGSLTVLPVPIAGIAAVTNPAPTALEARDESDAELRERAKNVLHGSERATLGALAQAVRRQGVTADVEEPPDRPGCVEITVHADAVDPELQQRILKAIEDARPAGVVVELKGIRAPRRVNLSLRLTTAAGLLEQDLRAAQRAARSGIEGYFATLPAREAGSLNRIIGLVLAVAGIQDVRILGATWTSADGSDEQDVLDRDAGVLSIAGEPTVLGELQIADPGLPTRVAVIISHPESADPPNIPQIETGLSAELAYLNDLAATEGASEEARLLTHERMLFAVALPGKAAGSIAGFDAGASPPTGGELYDVRFVITLESGLTKILGADGGEYELTPFERLSLAGVSAEVLGA